MKANNNANGVDAPARGERHYAAIWRWHFYAGLIVIPYFLIAALTGLVMAVKGPVEAVAYRDLLFVSPAVHSLPPSVQLAAVKTAYPHSDVTAYITPPAKNRSSRFMVSAHHGGGGHEESHQPAKSITVFVDPYTAYVLGALDEAKTPYAIAKKIHGTLMIGLAGDYLIEVLAGFGVIMLVTGLYLWFSRDRARFVEALAPRIRKFDRLGWRSLHASLGVWLSIVLLFFLISGLSWTPFWGGKLTQAWSTFPSERFRAPVAAETHETLNHEGMKEMPWALEQTALPVSTRGADGTPPSLDSVAACARLSGFTGFRIFLPKDQRGAWTVSAVTMSGDIADPRRDRTMHIDQHSGKVLADVRFSDYSIYGKAMAAGVSLHQGSAGPLNVALNVAFCFAIIVMIVSGAIMWWLRRPEKGMRLALPPPPRDRRQLVRAGLAVFAVSLVVPLTAVAVAVIFAADLLAFSQKR